MGIVCNTIQWRTSDTAQKLRFFGKDLGDLLRMPFSSRVHLTQEALAAGQPILVECGAVSMDQTLGLIHTAVVGGAAGISVVTPLFFGVTERELGCYYQQIAQALPENLPLYLRCAPQLGNNSISRALLQQLLAQLTNVKGIIDSTTDAVRMLTLARDRDYQLLTDCDAVFDIAVLLGYDGLIRS